MGDRVEADGLPGAAERVCREALGRDGLFLWRLVRHRVRRADAARSGLRPGEPSGAEARAQVEAGKGERVHRRSSVTARQVRRAQRLRRQPRSRRWRQRPHALQWAARARQARRRCDGLREQDGCAREPRGGWSVEGFDAGVPDRLRLHLRHARPRSVRRRGDDTLRLPHGPHHRRRMAKGRGRQANLHVCNAAGSKRRRQLAHLL
mmetsp:Transcript_22179/g.48359  ORF Transcript_22179/g.48359 Transcript_22179/m.48359 type:complete len:206 (+) Transcript_22179:381-998(+)